ncbi:hypothetical protein NELLIE_9 [Arthrobacter phage Nellie]|uniref:Uncharacterized protein n=4 Tax=Jasminevirus adat TaxID=2560299 RepID=A0A249XPP9_9CAUD|nr:hypothetical protein FDI47_gp09 [Arthrobacter phage Adat]ASZ73164.1 hypothetical protein GURGLEFERB_9 [Arthrobacter phage GurgleFerb]ASZ73728.1 hypothetical protein NELLIE_9 [Arthrobacter phage Nellie]AXH43698.1 hypothetical protein SEA_BRAD_9 [Arthrobacter phage Brad]USL89091.1 hypothetical protein SEA_CASSEROLE_9 [Arthrobacter phage Casserole]ASZ72582.1 hypothetical protein ADAT_9 [Arthrobacter phage Adat]
MEFKDGTEGQKLAYTGINARISSLRNALQLLPDNEDKDRAFMKLEELVFHANCAVGSEKEESLQEA